MKKRLIETFNSIAPHYDEERRSLIPCFDDFYSVIVELAASGKERPAILDIGAGTGLLTGFLLKKFPKARFTLIDISGEMLEAARRRFKRKKNVGIIRADYAHHDFSGSFDIIVSALSIHHLHDREKASLYKRMYVLLNDGGIFINGDQFAAASQENERICQRHWRECIETSPLSREKKDGAYARMKLDKTRTVDENIGWLMDAGFTHVEVFYKYFNFGVMYGKK
ncbi:MAG: class I SAM-dependent methyltransferase [Spirochaetales bacterium]|nr:class I SAM-dependent methyltransferase [Spirochaetales bacterium]